MTRPTAVLAIAACCSYPLLSHLGAATRDPLWPAGGIGLVAWALLSVPYPGLRAVLLGLLAFGLGVGLSVMFPGLLLYMPSSQSPRAVRIRC